MSVDDLQKKTDPKDVNTWTFERFEAGALIGSSSQQISEEIVESWTSIYEPLNGRESLPYGITQLVTMKAYADVVAPRPPGNIHAAHRCHLYELPTISNVLTADVYCIEKYVRRNRNMVDFRVDVKDAVSGRPLCQSVLKICWAT